MMKEVMHQAAFASKLFTDGISRSARPLFLGFNAYHLI